MDIQIIDAEDLPKEDMPAKTNKKLVVAIGFVLGIMISFGYTLYNYYRCCKDLSSYYSFLAEGRVTFL